MNTPTNNPEHSGENTPEQTPKQPDAVVGGVQGSVQKDVENLTKSHTLEIKDLASECGLQEVEKELPNGRVINTIEWSPANLPEVFKLVEQKVKQLNLGRNDVVVINGACPTWLLPTISHACHPVRTSVSYPQGGPGATMPLSGAIESGEGSAENVAFSTGQNAMGKVVEFSLNQPQIDIAATLKSLLAPEVAEGQPVFISGRGPIAIAATLAEAYAHKVPFVANFQPGTGFVVSISHDEKHPVGTVFQAEDIK